MLGKSGEQFWKEHDERNIAECDIHFISFHRRGTSGYNCLSLGKGEKPRPWHIEKLREVVRAYEAGEYDEHAEADHSDLC